ncbi:hypothetical protein GW750_00800 [bacterium]|nr:hypothetical protein [bacterium]
MELYVEKQDYYAAAELKKKQEKLKDTMHHLRNNKNIPIHMRPLVEEHDIGQVLADKT